MYLKFQRFSNNTWTDYGRVTLPLKLIDTMTDNTTAAMGITTYLKGTDYSLAVLPPGEIVRLNFSTKIWYFVVIDSSEIDPHTLTQYKYHSYTVQELLCYFRETYIQTAFFTNGRYTLDAFLERLIALSKCDYSIDISTADAYSTMLANWNSPDYQVASNALLDNLIKIGKSLQVRLKARINASNNIEIYAKKLKGNTVLSTLNGRKLSTVPQYKGANYAAKVVANVSNMANDVETWFPADDPGFGIIPTPEDGSTTADADSIFIELPFAIRKATIVRVAGKGTLVPTAIFQQGDWYDRFMNLVPPYSEALPAYVWENDNAILSTENNYSGAYTTFNVVEQREWRLLDPDDTNNASQHQQNTLYFKRGENKIYNIKICNGAGENFNTDVAYTYVEGGVDYPKYQRLYYHMNRYVVYGNFYTTNDLVKTNSSTSKRTTIYSQSQNSVDGDELIKNMQDHIDSMQNQDLQESWEFESIDDVPEVGSIYNGMVISEIQLSIDSKINAVIQLSDDLVPKSEYVSADGGLNLPAIPLDKSFDRFKTYSEKLWFCRTLTEASSKISIWGAGEYINPVYKNKYFDSLTPSRNGKCYAAKEIRLETGNFENDVVYSALVPITYNLGTTLITAFKTYDNVSAGVVRSFALGLLVGDVRYFNVPFINSDGMSKELLMKGGISSSSQNESNYPALGSQSMNLGDWLFQILDDEYYHDPSEIINNAYQIDYVVANKQDIISSSFLTNASVLKETYGESVAKAVLINSNYYAIQTYTETIVTSSITKITVTVQGTFTPINGARVDYRLGANPVLSMTLDVTEVDSNTRKIEFYVAYTKA